LQVALRCPTQHLHPHVYQSLCTHFLTLSRPVCLALQVAPHCAAQHSTCICTCPWTYTLTRFWINHLFCMPSVFYSAGGTTLPSTAHAFAPTPKTVLNTFLDSFMPCVSCFVGGATLRCPAHALELNGWWHHWRDRYVLATPSWLATTFLYHMMQVLLLKESDQFSFANIINGFRFSLIALRNSCYKGFVLSWDQACV